MLHLGEHDRVARAELAEPPGVGDEVQRLGGVLREHHLLAAVGADELGEAVVGLLVGLGGLLAQRVDAPVDVRVVAPVVVGDRLEHRLGRVGGRGVVEVDQRDALADLPLEDREVRPDRLGVQRVLGRRAHRGRVGPGGANSLPMARIAVGGTG